MSPTDSNPFDPSSLSPQTKPASESKSIVDPFTELSLLLTGYPHSIEGKWFHNQKVELDGYRYQGCRFDNCQLVTSKASFEMDHCAIENCNLILGDVAFKTVQLLAVNVPQSLKVYFSKCSPTFNSDGTFTIK